MFDNMMMIMTLALMTLIIRAIVLVIIMWKRKWRNGEGERQHGYDSGLWFRLF